MKKAYIDNLSFLKLIAVIGIIVCHMGLLESWQLCARMVEVLFVLSGFLMAYNHYEEKEITAGWQIIRSKLPRFYPIHLLCFMLQFLFVATWATKPLSYFFSVGLLNLSLQHAWFIGTEFSYNNVSWYLSALVFAYAMTPMIKKIVKAGEQKSYGLLKIFLSVVIVRFYLEYLVENAHRLVPLDLHCNPFVQMLNYSLGYIAGVLFLRKNILNQTLTNTLSDNALTLLQSAIIGLYLAICYCFAGSLRFYFILSALPLIYVLGFNRGLLQKISALKPVQYFAQMTLELFMFHSFILYKLPTTPDNPPSYLIFLSVTVIVAILYHTIYVKIRKRF